MKKAGILCVSLLLLFVLLGAMVFRYGQFETFDRVVRYTDGWTGMEVEAFEKATRYVDRWTGIEWVKVDHIYGGESLELAKYEESAEEFMRIVKTKNALLFTWWVLLLLSLGGIVMAFIKPRAVQR